MLDSRRTSAATRIAFVAVACTLVLAGCAVTPEPLKSEEVRKRTAADQYLLYAEQEPITGPIDLNTAIARALKYSLDYRLKLMERALATGLWEVARYDMLPKVVASAGYATRDNDSGGTSVSIINGQETLSPSTSQERNRWLANAEFSWNVLDFGLSYYRAKQLADETLISEERRRRVIQNIVQDTRSAYWRAVGAQRLAKKADDLLVRAKAALAKSRQAETQGLLPPVRALSYQRELLDATTQLNLRRQELEFSKRELAALMNVTPGTNFTLADEKEPQLPRPPRNIGELEEVALENRPELREEDYRKRISVAETRKALLSLLPGISFDVAARYDSNKYLYNQSWIDGGLQIFSNLMRLLAYPSVEKANEARIATDDARRVALSMAIITQVRVAIQRYELSLVDLDLADQSTQVDARLAQYARVALSMRVDSELELVRTEAWALIEEFQRYASYANAQAAYGRILNSLGVDVLPDAVESADVNTLATAVAAQIDQAARDTFPVVLTPVTAPAPPIRVEIENVKNQELKYAAEEAVTRVLRSAGYTLDRADRKAWILRMHFDRIRVSGGVGRGVWNIRLERSDGTLAGRAEYSSPLAAQFGPSTMDAFTDAATASQLHALDGWLRDAKSVRGGPVADASVGSTVVQSTPSTEASNEDAAIRAAATAWAQAWAAQDVERYLTFYAPEFKPPDGQSRRAWEKLRRARISGPRSIQLSIRDIEVRQRDNDRAAATFRQDYRSDGYEDSVRKTLELVRDGGRWLIAEERVVSTAAETGAAFVRAPASEAASAKAPAPAPVAAAPAPTAEAAPAESPTPAPTAETAPAEVPAPAPVAAAATRPAPSAGESAGLGDLQVLSKLGRPLRAEIEITSLPGEDTDNFVVRLASAEAFREAGLVFHPALNGVNMAIERRGGKPVIALTTRLPLNEPILNVLFELEWGSRRFVRDYAIVLDPPNYHAPPLSHAEPEPAGNSFGLLLTPNPVRDANIAEEFA
jgi:outer membrane protein TolC/ketosteroid isomerase-like protein